MGFAETALKKSRKKVVTREQCNQVRKNLKKALKTIKKSVQSSMRSEASSIWKTIRGSVERGGKKTQKGKELWIFDSEGKRLCSVEEYLKGAYRQGRYEAKAWYLENKGITSGRLKKKNQKKGTYIIKGTGKCSSNERENIQNVRNRDVTDRKLVREIRKQEDERKRFLRRSKYKSWSDDQRYEAAASAMEKKRLIQKLKTKQRRNARLKRYHNIRIVARDKHDVQAREVQTHQQWRIASKPYMPPKTWTGSLKKAIIYKVFKDAIGFRITATPRSGGNTQIYRILEYGGSVSNERYKHGALIGYQVVAERASIQRSDGRTQAFAHRRVSLRRKYDDPKEIQIQPRPFFGPAKERLMERLPHIFGDGKILQPFFNGGK